MGRSSQRWLLACASGAALLAAQSAAAQTTPPSVDPAVSSPPAAAPGQADQTIDPAQASPEVGPDVVVTGSYIAGTPKDSAIPVAVVSRDELLKRGSPTVLDVVKTLPLIGPVLGDTNQFNAGSQGRNGGGTINLRGIGAQRTLLLLNGRRFGGGTADSNLLPVAAIGRIEILKDGAAATYGSDAIGGVANFITRRDLKGFEVIGDYRFVRGSLDNDYSGAVNFGWGRDRANVFLSAAYQHRSELGIVDKG